MNLLSKTLVAAAACVTFSAQATLINANGANHSFDTAQSLNGFFSTEFDANITNSTVNPHVSVYGQGADAFDFYSFTIGANTRVLFDIDGGMPDLDSWLNLYSADGSLIFSHDDGHAGDAGSSHGWDSYLNWDFAQAGTYVISVGRFPNSPINVGQDYTLHVSTAPIPEPETYAMLAAGLAAVGFARRRKAATK